jgi:hypothetical protein
LYAFALPCAWRFCVCSSVATVVCTCTLSGGALTGARLFNKHTKRRCLRPNLRGGRKSWSRLVSALRWFLVPSLKISRRPHLQRPRTMLRRRRCENAMKCWDEFLPMHWLLALIPSWYEWRSFWAGAGICGVVPPPPASLPATLYRSHITCSFTHKTHAHASHSRIHSCTRTTGDTAAASAGCGRHHS